MLLYPWENARGTTFLGFVDFVELNAVSPVKYVVKQNFAEFRTYRTATIRIFFF